MYHQPLRTTFRKVKVARPNVSPDIDVSISVKAINDTLGSEGLVKSALVFGEYPQVFTPYKTRPPRPSVSDRENLPDIARKEMGEIMAKLRVKRALHHAVPPASDHPYENGDQFLVWREKKVANRIGEWV